MYTLLLNDTVQFSLYQIAFLSIKLHTCTFNVICPHARCEKHEINMLLTLLTRIGAGLK